MAVNVTIHHSAFGDARYVRLAKLAGYANADESLGKMARIWSLCTELQTDRPPVAQLRAVLDGQRGLDAMIEVELADPTDDDGLVRVHGCDGRINWYSEVASRQEPSRQSKAGKQRVKNAPRGPDGRLLPRTPAPGKLEPAPFQHPLDAGPDRTPAQPSRLDGAGPAHDQHDQHRLQQEPSSAPVAGGLAGLAGPATPASLQPSELDPESGRGAPAPSGSGSGSIEASSDPEPGRSREHDPAHANGAPRSTSTPNASDERTSSRVFDVSPPGAVDADPALIARRAQGHRAWDHLNRMRRELAMELGLPEPMHLHDQLGGRVDLADRLRDAGSERAAELELEHVFAVAIAEARAKRTLRWFGPAMFRPDAWGRMLTMDPTDMRASSRPEERNVFDEVDRASAMIAAQRRARHDPTIPCADPSCDVLPGCPGSRP